MAPMKPKSDVELCGVAPNVTGEPLSGMPTQPVTDATTATSTHVRRARASRRPVSGRRRPERIVLQPVLATRDHLGDLAGGVEAPAQAGGDLRLVRAERQ